LLYVEGRDRWVVQGAIGLLHWFCELRIPREIPDDIHLAFVTLSCAIICWRWKKNERGSSESFHGGRF